MNINNPHDRPFMLSEQQTERVLDELVPLVSEPGEEGVTRFLLRKAAEGMNSSSFAVFVKKTLETAAAS